jgi:hypothetical protein
MHFTKAHISGTIRLRQESVQSIFDTLKDSQAGDIKKHIAKAYSYYCGSTAQVTNKSKIDKLDSVD